MVTFNCAGQHVRYSSLEHFDYVTLAFAAFANKCGIHNGLAFFVITMVITPSVCGNSGRSISARTRRKDHGQAATARPAAAQFGNLANTHEQTPPSLGSNFGQQCSIHLYGNSITSCHRHLYLLHDDDHI